jgi:hypothetical protein
VSEHSKPVRLAATAYHAALAGRWQAAADAVVRISDECGGEGLSVALRAWCDTYADHSTGGQPGVPTVNINFIRTDTGQLDDQRSERVPPEIRWAGELLRARAALDQERWSELLAELPDDGEAIGDHVFAVLKGVALTINGLPRGYARMGRGGAS